MGFKENLKMLRKAKGMTQKEFGKLINKTLLTVSRYENGTIFPTQNTLKEICKIFDIELTNFLMDVEYENRKYNIDEIKAILRNKRNIMGNNVLHELAHIALSEKKSDKNKTNQEKKDVNFNRIYNEVWKEAEKNFSLNELESSIFAFSLLLHEELSRNFKNISDNDKIKVLEDLKKYYLFLMSNYKNNN